MQSIPGLKKCFNFVATLSKKLLSNVIMTAHSPTVQKTQEKSPQKHQKPERTEPKPNEFQGNQKQTSSGQKLQGPKIICFETYLHNRSNPLKGPSLRLGSGAIYNYQKPISETQQQKTKIQQSKEADNIHKNQPYKKIENRYSNPARSTHQSTTQKGHNIISRNSNPLTKKDNKDLNDLADDQLSDDEMRAMSKKDKKIIKKQQKNISVAECLDINTDDMIFTYDDGDDISSIAAKSETTDQIQPQLLSFINKRAFMNNLNKFEEHKINNFPSANMKKKTSHYQGETVQRKNSNILSPKQEKKPQFEPISIPKPKKRAFQLYPGETFEQFKKRILIQNKSSSSQNSDDDKYFPGKLIKKEEYDKILSQLNNSMSKMDEQRNKQASILVVQKMVDESQNQESENCFKRQQPVLENIQNYKVWDNAGENASFRLYYRDS